MRRPGGCSTTAGRHYRSVHGSSHPLSNERENARLFSYEHRIKKGFDGIVPVLKKISALQHEDDFEVQAQGIAQQEFGFELPQDILTNAWVNQLDMPRLFAWCVFQTYRRFSDEFFTQSPLSHPDENAFNAFIQACGFHTVDVTPCADGRLAHVVRYVLRLPHRMVRRNSFAGSRFDIEDNVEKWVGTEMLRYREGKPNTADKPTRYLKVVVYHFSSVDPEHQGCAFYGSDDARAVNGGLEQLNNFKTAIENSFCCGASIDLLLIGMDTDTDAIRLHVPDSEGEVHADRFVNAMDIFQATQRMSMAEGKAYIIDQVRTCSPETLDGTVDFAAYLIENNLSQIDYVRQNFDGAYPDTGHAERFIGAGIGFEDNQLRNLKYFVHLQTVEEASADIDLGIKIFKGLNVSNGLPVPVVVRFDYQGQVPGARERAYHHCQRVARAFTERYSKLVERGMLHILQVARDCNSNAPIEVIGCSVDAALIGDH